MIAIPLGAQESYMNLPNPKPMEIFITGGTGGIGRCLLPGLLDDPGVSNVMLLSRKRPHFDHPKLKVFQGDITLPGLGLSGDLIRQVQRAQEVYHLAADCSLSSMPAHRAAIFMTNADGTRNILEILKPSQTLTRFVHMSSAYACGRTPDIISEDWMPRPTSFRNTYEETKWLAEDLIRISHSESGIPFTILRPSIVWDKSIRDKTILCYSSILERAARMDPHRRIRLMGSDKAALNLIRLDDLISIIHRIRQGPSRNMILNLVDPASIPSSTILSLISESLDRHFEFQENLDDRSLSAAEAFAFRHTQPFWPYLCEDPPRWDYARIARIKGCIRSINLTEMKETIRSLLRNHEPLIQT